MIRGRFKFGTYIWPDPKKIKPMKNEQKIQTTTFIKLDLVDCLKCLFGRTIKVTTNMFIPQENEINRFNSTSTVEIVSTTSHFTKKDKPDYGYSPKDEKER